MTAIMMAMVVKPKPNASTENLHDRSANYSYRGLYSSRNKTSRISRERRVAWLDSQRRYDPALAT
jgi:hypothetical protein